MFALYKWQLNYTGQNDDFTNDFVENLKIFR